MNELLKTILSLSLSGSFLILILLLCRPIVRDRLSKQWQYYIWLVVISRLLLPFTPEASLVGNLFQHVGAAAVLTDADSYAEPNDMKLDKAESDDHDRPAAEQPGAGGGNYAGLKQETRPGIFHMAAQNAAALCLSIWLIVAVGLLIRKVTIYQSFVKYINAGRVEISDMALWEQIGSLIEQTGVRGAVGLYTNSLISSPLLIGFFRPCIMLPSAELPDSDFQYTILHELTHYKRRDMFYKWLVQISICLHWFNPLVYLMGREINRACEFSCDEAVIKSLDKDGRRAYGDTLLNAVNLGGTYKDSLASVTLNRSAELLKERLDAIMHYRKKSKATAVITGILTLALLYGASFTGAYAADLHGASPAQLNTQGTAAPDVPITDSAEDVSRLTKELVSDDILSMITTCNPGIWYVIEGTEYQYIYYSGLPHNYAYQPQSDANGLSVSVFDMGKGNVDYVLIAVPRNVKLTIFYNSREVSYTEKTKQFVDGSDSAITGGPYLTVDSCSIQYEDAPYRWPFVRLIVTNNSDRTISRCDVGLLAYDKDGQPLELYWDARNVAKNGEVGSIGFSTDGTDYGIVTGIEPNSPKSYQWLTSGCYESIAPGKSSETDGLHLFDGWWDQPGHIHKVSYLLACVKQITFEDGTVWNNPEYENWYTTYQGVPVDLDVAKSYYD